MKDENPKIFMFDNIILLTLLFSPITFTKRLFDEAQASLFDVGNLTRIIAGLLCVSLVFIAICLRKYKSIEGFSTPFKFMVMYWIVSFISIINTSWLSYSVVKYLEYLILILAIYYLVNRSRNNTSIIKYSLNFGYKFMEFLILSVIVGVIISPSTGLYNPTEAHIALSNSILPYRLNGFLIPLSNTAVGFIASILFFNYIIDLTTKEFKNLSFLFIKFFSISVVIVLSQSRMALFSLMIVLLWYFFFINKQRFYQYMIIIASLILLILFSQEIIGFIYRGQTSDEIFTLTGRTKWWSHAVNVFSEGNMFDKLFGFGFAAGEKEVAAQSSDFMYTLDSDYLANLISTGLIGLTNMVGMMIAALYQVIKLTKSSMLKNLDKNEKNYVFKSAGIILILIIRCSTVTTFSLLSLYLIMFIVVCQLNHQLLHFYSQNEKLPNLVEAL